jgi:hypothetical protein
MRKVTFLIAICFVLAVMVATIAAQGGGGGRGGGGGQRGPAVAPTGPAPTGANGAADLQGIMQRVQYNAGQMRGKLQATPVDAAAVAEDLGTLQSLFMAAQTAFAKEKSGAEPLAKAAAAAAGEAQKAAKSGKADAATTKAVTDSCNGCHNGPPAYRTKDPGTGAYMLAKP